MKTLTTQEQRKIKDHFERWVDRRSRKAMITFLTNHFRYSTINIWNKSTSYAHNIKVTHLKATLPDNISPWDMLECPEWHSHMNHLMQDFDATHNHEWQVGTNGRSNGYIVLYQGGIKNGRPFSYPGRSLDQNEDFHKWYMNDLSSRVCIVQDFDMLVADIVMEFGAFCRSYDVVDKVIPVSTTIQVLREKP